MSVFPDGLVVLTGLRGEKGRRDRLGKPWKEAASTLKLNTVILHTNMYSTDDWKDDSVHWSSQAQNKSSSSTPQSCRCCLQPHGKTCPSFPDVRRTRRCRAFIPAYNTGF